MKPEIKQMLIGAVVAVAILYSLGLINIIGTIDVAGNVVCPYGAKKCVVPFNINHCRFLQQQPGQKR